MNIEAKEVSKVLENYLNRYGHPEKALIDELETWHRTIQQVFSKLCVAWFRRMSEPDFTYDKRNEASVKLARKLKKLLEDSYLPMI
jgi:hypothetical protein